MRVRVSRVVLVGLSGAGKSTIGPLLAERLRWRFIDPDLEVERATGLDIPAIFRTRGEAEFRQLEAAAVAAALAGERVVIAPGAGWAAQPGALDGIGGATAIVWLRIAPALAARRLEAGGPERPLLARADMASRLDRMHAERSPFYSRADIAVDTDDRAPEDVAAFIAARLAAEYEIDGRAD